MSCRLLNNRSSGSAFSGDPATSDLGWRILRADKKACKAIPMTRPVAKTSCRMWPAADQVARPSAGCASREPPAAVVVVGLAATARSGVPPRIFAAREVCSPRAETASRITPITRAATSVYSIAVVPRRSFFAIVCPKVNICRNHTISNAGGAERRPFGLPQLRCERGSAGGMPVRSGICEGHL